MVSGINLDQKSVLILLTQLKYRRNFNAANFTQLWLPFADFMLFTFSQILLYLNQLKHLLQSHLSLLQILGTQMCDSGFIKRNWYEIMFYQTESMVGIVWDQDVTEFSAHQIKFVKLLSW